MDIWLYSDIMCRLSRKAKLVPVFCADVLYGLPKEIGFLQMFLFSHIYYLYVI